MRIAPPPAPAPAPASNANPGRTTAGPGRQGRDPAQVKGQGAKGRTQGLQH